MQALNRKGRLLTRTYLMVLLVTLFINTPQLLKANHEQRIVSLGKISQAEPLSPMILNLSMSHPPYLNEMVELAFNVTPLFESQDTTIQILLPDSFIVVDGSLTWKGYLAPKQQFQLTALVKAIRTGSFEIKGTLSNSYFTGADFLYTEISESTANASKSKYQVMNETSKLLESSGESIQIGSPGTITVVGSFVYFDKDTGWEKPIRYAKVELYDSDALGNQLLYASSTDAAGSYSLGPVDNSDLFGWDGQDIFVVFYLQTAAVKVQSSSGVVYGWKTSTVSDVPDGTYNMGKASLGQEGAANIYDTVIEAYQYVDLYDSPPSQVTVVWPDADADAVSWYNDYTNTIYLEGPTSATSETPEPDEWDASVIVHEYGHFIMDTYAQIPPRPWSTDQQNWLEGWAQFFQSPVRHYWGYPNPERYVETTWSVSLETWTTGDTYMLVGSILWDIYDAPADDQNGDGIGDNLASGFGNIWDVFRNYFTGGHHVYTVHEFWDGWLARGHDYKQQMWAVYYEHGINKDTSPPSNPTSFSSSPPTGVWSSDNTVEVSWSGASDDCSGVYGYSRVWDTNPTTMPDEVVDQTTTYCISFPLSTGNSWYFHIRTRDNAGRWASSGVHVGPFYIDTAVPNTPSLSESHCGSSWTLHNSPYFTWNNPGDTGSGVSYYQASINDGAPFTVSTPYHPTWSDGTYRFKVRAIDGAGNPGYWSNIITVKIDATAPAGSIIINSGATYTTSTSVTLTLSAVDGSGSGVVYMCFSNDGSSWSSWEYYGSSKSWALTSGDGIKTVYVRYKDYVGLESSVASDAIMLDAQPPSSITLSSPPSGAETSNNKPTFTWNPATDATSGIASYTFQIDTSTTFNSGNLKTISGIISTSYAPDTPLSGGTWYWRVCAKDNAGNNGLYSSYWSLTITVPDFQLWIDPSSRRVQPGGSTTYTVYLKSVYGFSGEVSLAKSIDPSEPTITLTLDSTITLGADQTKTLTLSAATTASTPEGSYVITITGTCGTLTHSSHATFSISVQSTQSDFDGDGSRDLIIWRPSNGYWYILKSSTNYEYSTYYCKAWGTSGDVPIANDFDGDGSTDLTIWRPSNGRWYILKSTSGYSTSNPFIVSWGTRGDIPLMGYVDGDSKADLVIWRPSNGHWYILLSSIEYSLSSPLIHAWGTSGDIPLLGDIDGDGKADLVIWRPSNGIWYILLSGSGYTASTARLLAWGIRGDIPLVGDFDGDGKADLIIWRPSNGYWYVLKSSTGFSYSSCYLKPWGTKADIPLLGDMDNDGKADLTIWRPGNGFWFILKSSNNYEYSSCYIKPWGTSGDSAL